MALRVLLADESLNVKKNIQLCLQDYGVEIKTLLSGEEVGTSARTFKPDIIFLDILLAKINGYDACSQLKNHPDFRHIPVILTWSSFMEIDETKFKQSRADSRLEKPFDKDSLRKLIQHFVPKVKSQGLSEFLTLPELRPFNEDPQESANLYSKTLTHFAPRGVSFSEIGIDDEPDEFQHAPPPFQSTTPEISPLTTQNEDVEEWVPQKTSPPSSSYSPAMMEESYEVEIAKVHLPENLPTAPPPAPELETYTPPKKVARKPASPGAIPPPIPASPSISLDPQELKKMIQAEIRPLLEEVLQQILPEIAERVIREEIQKLMHETEQEI